METQIDKLDICIIVPVYNAEKYIESCIKSIVSQTFKNFELILVNDGSTDENTQFYGCKWFATDRGER